MSLHHLAAPQVSSHIPLAFTAMDPMSRSVPAVVVNAVVNIIIIIITYLNCSALQMPDEIKTHGQRRWKKSPVTAFPSI